MAVKITIRPNRGTGWKIPRAWPSSSLRRQQGETDRQTQLGALLGASVTKPFCDGTKIGFQTTERRRWP